LLRRLLGWDLLGREPKPSWRFRAPMVVLEQERKAEVVVDGGRWMCHHYLGRRRVEAEWLSDILSIHCAEFATTGMTFNRTKY
jgi:hypothetical protein